MADAKRRKIRQLRALADSTTFPAEAASARAKADELEAQLKAQTSTRSTRASYRTYTADEWANLQAMIDEVVRDEMRRLMEDAIYGTRGPRGRPFFRPSD